jgi:hypothetical protein
MTGLQNTIAQAMVVAHLIPRSLADAWVSTMQPDDLATRLNWYIEDGWLANDNWLPACGGTEQEFRTRSGFRLLYCWQPSTGNHAYLNLDTDIILSDDEAMTALGVF